MPEQKGGGKAKGPEPMPAGSMSTFLSMFVMMFILLILMTPSLRLSAGRAMSGILFPTIGFGALYPLFTIFAAGILMVAFSTPIRHFLTDWAGQGRHAMWSSHVNELRKKAMTTGNPQAMRKVNDMNIELMRMSGDRMSSTMKTMVFTMIFAMLVFMWLSVFMYYDTSITTVSTPWDPAWDLRASGPLLHLFPQWIILYSLLSLPLGQVLAGALKFATFPRRIAAIEKEEAGAKFRKKAGIVKELEEAEEKGEGKEEKKEGKEAEEEGGEEDKEDEDLEVEESDELEIEDSEEEEEEEGKEKDEKSDDDDEKPSDNERKRKNK